MIIHTRSPGIEPRVLTTVDTNASIVLHYLMSIDNLCVIIFTSPVYFFPCKNNAVICCIFLCEKKWLINFTLYTVRISISRAFQKYIGLYAFEFFILVKTSRHWSTHFVRNYFYLPGLLFSCEKQSGHLRHFFRAKKVSH